MDNDQATSDTAADTTAADDRSALAEAFVDKYGWSEAERELLPASASEKAIIRLTDSGVDPESQAIFVDWLTPGPVVNRFIRIQELLHNVGISAPEIMARDLDHGFMLVEDFGNETFSSLIDGGAEAKPLLTRATKLLIALHKRFEAPMGTGLRVFDAATFADQAALFLDTYMRGADLLPEDPMELQEMVELFIQVWEAVLGPACEMPQSLILRDYILDNLMLLEVTEEGVDINDTSAFQRVGVLDFQDGGMGPGIYDLVSLLEDVRRDLAPEVTQAMRQGYLKIFPDLDREQFQTAYNVLKAQRMVRVLGVFAEMAVEEGDDSYMKYVPRCWRLLEEAFEAEPELDGVRAWFERNVPAEFRADLVT
ncbi:MAG: phosphotransferase [Alphaproteobacteria bacterium]|nr:phosphotransferase [Alphaproteobacteria bacterium SS10]